MWVCLNLSDLIQLISFGLGFRVLDVGVFLVILLSLFVLMGSVWCLGFRLLISMKFFSVSICSCIVICLRSGVLVSASFFSRFAHFEKFGCGKGIKCGRTGVVPSNSKAILLLSLKIMYWIVIWVEKGSLGFWIGY